jgi:hypothetical protein
VKYINIIQFGDYLDMALPLAFLRLRPAELDNSLDVLVLAILCVVSSLEDDCRGNKYAMHSGDTIKTMKMS